MTSETPLRWVRRTVFGVRQEDLAEIGGVSRPRVSRYESGQDDPPFKFLSKLRDEARRRGLPFSGDWFFQQPATTDTDVTVVAANDEEVEP